MRRTKARESERERKINNRKNVNKFWKSNLRINSSMIGLLYLYPIKLPVLNYDFFSSSSSTTASSSIPKTSPILVISSKTHLFEIRYNVRYLS